MTGITDEPGTVRGVDDEVRSVPAAEPPSILSKAFDLLRAFNSESRVMTLSELSRASGLPKSTVHRLIARLIDLGAVETHRSGYVVSLDLLQLAVNTPAGGMRDNALPFLAALHRWSGLSVELGVLRQFDVLFLDKMARHGAPEHRAGVGSRLPANATALGKILLASENLEDLESFLPRPMPLMSGATVTDVDELVIELRKVRGDAIAHERDEAQPGVSSSAVPIIIHDFAVGAVSVTYATGADVGAKVQNALRDTAAQIARVCKAEMAQGKTHYFPHEL
ncbi:IclR family transcriptional regulator [Nocardioides sp.]|uniref:IclR family transcriptional regulator n=1 Tax=Nocardioides sp. TaxID=35761 RepID=UPI00263484B6|nr:IclR family transcriptional regulator [Nocardioides sp.]